MIAIFWIGVCKSIYFGLHKLWLYTCTNICLQHSLGVTGDMYVQYLCYCFMIVNAGDIPCSDLHIAEISRKFESWEELAPFFGISPEEEEEIRNDNPGQYLPQKRKMLWKWKQRLGSKATYNKLKDCFSFAGNQLLADQVDELLHNHYSQSRHSALKTFKPRGAV